MRLQAWLAKAGLGARRKSEEIIKAGRVKVNGKTAKLGDSVTEKDKITVDNEDISANSDKIYIMLNKPAGYLCARTDMRGKKTVYELLDFPTEIKNTLINVGRLDYDTTGLLLITNDGEWAQQLAHPKHEVKKVYIAKIQGRICDAALSQIRAGVVITAKQDDKEISYLSKPKNLRLLGRGKEYSVLVVTLITGRKREVKRIFKAVNHKVLALKRIEFGVYKLGDLQEGKYIKINETLSNKCA